MKARKWIARMFGADAAARRPIRRRSPLNCEYLEDRTTPTAAIDPIADFTSPTGKDLLVPVSLVSDAGAPVNYSVATDNAGVGASVLTGGRSLRLDVTGTDAAGQPFSGTLTLRLFEDQSPLATGRIIALTERGSYDNSIFHRIIDDFVIQGGDFQNRDGTGGSDLGDIADEFSRTLTFNSPGLLAMANSGDDTGDSQFFITDLDQSPLQQPGFLNFNHTIFGILTSGFDTYQKIITTPTSATDRPINDATITDAEIFTDTQHGVLRISAGSGFRGDATVTVTAEDGTGPSQESFNVSLVPDPVNDRAFLGPVSDVTTQVGTGVSFQLGGVDLDGDTLTFAVGSGNGIQLPPSNVTVDIDQPTGLVTLTPAAGFSGTVDLLVGVRDGTDRAGGGAGEFDTERITLTVTGDIDLSPESDTGVLPNDNVTADDTPTFTVNAPAGSTVTLTVNGGADLTAVESSPGVFSVTVPAGSLVVGPNTIAGRVAGTSPRDLTPLTVNFAPSLQDSYTVPGPRGGSRTVAFDFFSSETDFFNEIGLYVADGPDGSVSGVAPGDPGYAEAVFNSSTRQVIFSPSDGVGDTQVAPFTAGQVIGFYLVRNATSDQLLAANPTNAADGEVIAYFSFTAANPDGAEHLQATDDPLNSQVIYAWEDLPGDVSDFDYNDLVMIARPDGVPATISDFTLVPGALGRAVSVSFELETATQSPENPSPRTSTSTPGEVGIFFVDDASGSIGNLTPGTPGFTVAALAPDRRRVLFNPGSAVPTVTTLNLTGNQLFGIYYIPGGTADEWRANNPGNDPSVTPQAFFSPTAANPDGIPHVRTFSPELVSRTQPTNDGPTRFHLMGTFNGTLDQFDDVVFSMRVNG